MNDPSASPSKWRIPLAFKLLFWVFLGSIVCTLIASLVGDTEIALSLCLWLAFLGLIAFPGKNPSQPRLFSVAPIIWGVSIPVSLLLLAARLFPNIISQLPATETLRYPTWVLAITLALYPALIVTLVRRLPLFRWLMIVAALLEIFVAIGNSAFPVGPEPPSFLSLVLTVTFEIALITYFLIHFSPAIPPQDQS